ncbi:hypothetical protein FOA52_000247 [Chlamydomonas sp. UWO 241]|nr:hypothetical protein FOA52_000247 [Chlamydomonas sp. UWO 241]
MLLATPRPLLRGAWHGQVRTCSPLGVVSRGRPGTAAFVRSCTNSYDQAGTAAAFAQAVSNNMATYALMEAAAVEAALQRALPQGLHNVRVIDIGCGEGRWSRALAARGAVVTGVDPSQELVDMSNAAQKQKQQHEGAAGVMNGRVDFVHGSVLDPTCLAGRQPADLALSVMVLQMMRSSRELAAMAQFTAASLRPGGDMLFIFVSDAYEPCDEQNRLMAADWGWESRRTSPFTTDDGAAILAVLFTMVASSRSGDAVQVLNLQWPRADVERAFVAAGFTRLRWATFDEAVPGSEASLMYTRNPHAALLTATLAG